MYLSNKCFEAQAIQKLNVHTLSKAINNYDLKSIIKHPPYLATVCHTTTCGFNKCMCRYYGLSSIDILFDFEINNLKKNHLIEQLFENKWLSEPLIHDQNLINVMSFYRNNLSYDRLIQTLIKYIPKSRWIKAKIKDQTILDTIMSSSTGNKVKYLQLFIKIGCDPIQGNAFNLLDKAILQLDHEMVKFLLGNDKLKFGQNILFDLLSNNKYVKDSSKLNEIKKMVKLIIGYGYDTNYLIPSESKQIYQIGTTIYDYIIKYQWTEFLADIIPIPIHYLSEITILENPYIPPTKTNFYKYRKIINLAYKYRFCKDMILVNQILDILNRKIKYLPFNEGFVDRLYLKNHHGSLYGYLNILGKKS